MLSKTLFYEPEIHENGAYFGILAHLSLVIWKPENNKVWKNLIEKSSIELTERFMICVKFFFNLTKFLHPRHHPIPVYIWSNI